MKQTFKILTIVVCVFLIRLTLSCCRCREELVNFDFNTILIENLDNSTWRPIQAHTNSMLSTAVAFEIHISDSTIREIHFMAHQRTSFGFPSAMAMQPCECGSIFELNNEITKLAILTLEDISPQTPAGTDITQRFLWGKEREYLYQPMDSLLVNLNTPFIAFSPNKSMRVFYMDTVMTSQAQFVVEFQYADGQILSDTTNLIQITQSN